MKKNLILATSLIGFVLITDQVIKIWIKTHFILGQRITVCRDWFFINFIENNGMAFGKEFGGDAGKLMLSLLRIAAVIGIGWYLYKLSKTKIHRALIASIALIFAGAVGNILDSVFYGMLFNDSTLSVAQFMPSTGGYAGILHGKVVDMLYFPILNGYFPTWIPLIGGSAYEFFSPVFNIADSAITVGVVILIIFYSKFADLKKEEEAEATVANEVETKE